MLSLIVERALRGEASPRADLDFLEDSPALDELVEAAHLVTTKCASRVFNFCTIVNAKSGRCAEDCRWCSQSSKWTTNAPVFPIVPATRGESAAARALEHGIRRLSFVTSGRKLSARELREIRPVVEAAASTGLEVCASMGLLTEPELTGLREAGLVRYHCNLETGPDFFPKVCTTHTQTDKIRTLEAARRAGLELCSGGLFGMGETMADRIDLACGLRRLEIPSIPLNFLIPIPGTPLADRPPMTHDEVVRTVAVFRLVNPSACLRFAGGRQNLAPETARHIHAGHGASAPSALLYLRSMSVPTSHTPPMHQPIPLSTRASRMRKMMKRNIWAQPFFFLSLFARIENLRFHSLSLGFVFMLSLCQAFEYWESYPLRHRRPQENPIIIIIAQ